jgi:hypothetical protein
MLGPDRRLLPGPRARWLACLGLLGVVGWAPAAHAVLGEAATSLPAGSFGNALAQRSAIGPRVHIQSMPDGSTIRQFLGPDGRVYAVAWNTRSKPRLDLLLGTHFANFEAGGREAMRLRPGVMHSAAVRRGDLVVEASAHLNAHVGRAYLRSRLPAGVPLDALR